MIYEGPQLVVGNPFYFVIDDTANDPVSAFRVNTTWRTKAYLAHHSEVDDQGYAVYENLDEVRDSNRYGEDKYGRYESLLAAFNMSPQDKDAVRLDEAVGDFELPLDGERTLFTSYLAVVANEGTLLRFEPNPLWSRQHHMQLAVLTRAPGQVYGEGLAAKALGLDSSIQLRHNQILDAAAVAINPESKVVDDGVYDPDAAESGPGALHVVGDISNLQPLEKNLSGLNLAFSEVTMLQGMMEQIMRSSSQAASMQGAQSPTEIARNTSAMGADLQEIARDVEDNSLVPILEMQMQLTQQNMDEAVVGRIVQDGVSSFENISPEMVRRMWEIKPVGSANQMLKEKRLQDLMMFMQLVSGNELIIQSGMINLPYLLRVVYQELGFMDGDKVFNQPTPGFPQGMAPQGGGSGSPVQPPGGGSGNAPDQGFPGISSGDRTPPGAEAIGPFTQAAQHGIMGA